jgi:hypothetical protein
MIPEKRFTIRFAFVLRKDFTGIYVLEVVSPLNAARFSRILVDAQLDEATRRSGAKLGNTWLLK